jgi:hypothetical protein
MEDFDWIEDTPADEFEVGEELRFFEDCACYDGTYVRQEGDDIFILITSEKVLDDRENMVGEVVGFHRDNI